MTGASSTSKGRRAISTELAYPTLTAFCPDLDEWPQRWQIEDRDLPAGQDLVQALIPFLLNLLQSGLRGAALRRHRDNLWLLGGEIIRRLHDEPRLRRTPAADLLRSHLEDEGGPLIYPYTDESLQRSVDATCRKLYGYFQKSDPKTDGGTHRFR